MTTGGNAVPETPPETPAEAIGARRRKRAATNPPEGRGPHGRKWTVRRRWVTRLGTETVWGRFDRRFRKTMRRFGDGGDLGCVGEIGEGIVAAIFVVIFLVFLAFVLIPFLVALLDLLLVGILAVVGVAARGLLGRPWVVEAVDDRGSALRWKVKGWRASGERCTEIAELLATGITPPGAERVAATSPPPSADRAP